MAKEMSEKEVDYVYDNYYFKLNKKLQVYVGLWPYKSRLDKFVRRMAVYVVVLASLIPLGNGFRLWCGVDLDICGENVSGILYTLTITLKYWATILSEEKLERVYHQVAKNWLEITDSDEHAILVKYAEQGRIRTIVYLVYMAMAGFCFCQLPVVPIILDAIIPLNESRPKILFVKAEFIIDPYVHFYKLYMYFMIASVLSVTALTSIDTMYAVVVHQILGIFSVVKHRLYMATVTFDSKKDVSFDIVINAIRLHQEGLQFIDLLDSSYSLAFLLLMGSTVLFLSLGAVILVMDSRALLDLIRLLIVQIGVIIHFYYLTMPGQQLIDQISDLFISTYATEWYNISERSKRLLRIMMLRCIKPSYITAGGLYVMNLENFGSIMKSVISYITAIASFRQH